MRDVSNGCVAITPRPDITRRVVELVDHAGLSIEHHGLPVKQTRDAIRTSPWARGEWEQHRTGKLRPERVVARFW
jgi:hypothetical protein